MMARRALFHDYPVPDQTLVVVLLQHSHTGSSALRDARVKIELGDDLLLVLGGVLRTHLNVQTQAPSG